MSGKIYHIIVVAHLDLLDPETDTHFLPASPLDDFVQVRSQKTRQLQKRLDCPVVQEIRSVGMSRLTKSQRFRFGGRDSTISYCMMFRLFFLVTLTLEILSLGSVMPPEKMSANLLQPNLSWLNKFMLVVFSLYNLRPMWSLYK